MRRTTKWAAALAGISVILAGPAFVFVGDSTPPGTGTAGTLPEQPHADADHDGEGALEMSAAERQARGIETAVVGRHALTAEFSVPGEVMRDLYNSSQVTPRIAAQVMARHARLGDHVRAGQPLVTLSSVAVADAQGRLIVTDREWRRVRKLGREVVSERRYVEAQVAAAQSRAKLLAYGMTREQIAALLDEGDASKAVGTFQLLSPQDGVVIRDAFVVGELVEAGRVLFEISDESRVWVKAQLAPEQAAQVAIGQTARILIAGAEVASGHVVQAYHRLEETTRTQPVRIAVENAADALHPGRYVTVAISSGAGAPVLAVPASAVVLMDGASRVFHLEGDRLVPIPVQTGARRAGWIEIRAGLAPGDEIVTTQVFLLKSLIQKSRMGEGHGH